MRKLSLLLGLAFMTSLSLFAQDQDRSAFATEANESAVELQADFDMPDEHMNDFKLLLEQVMHKADYVHNSDKVEADRQEELLREIRMHYEKSVVKWIDESKLEEFMSASAQHVQFAK